MATQKITYELIPKSVDEIAEQTTLQNSGTEIAAIGYFILPEKSRTAPKLLEIALTCNEGFSFSYQKGFRLAKSLDTEDCIVKAQITPEHDKKSGELKGYLATMEYDPICTDIASEEELSRIATEFKTMLDKYFIINKRR